MAKIANPTPKRLPNGRWLLDVSAKASPTGNRQRLYFENRRQADLEALRLKSMRDKLGSESARLPAKVAMDAAKAAEILAPTGATLTEAAQAYFETWTARRASKTLAEAWAIREAEMEGLSDKHRRATADLGKKLCATLGERLLSDLTHGQVRAAILTAYPTAHGFNLALRTAGPVFQMAVREGWASENVLQRIQKLNTGRHEVQILTLEQCRKIMTCAQDYRQCDTIPESLRCDARGSIAALALMLFAGVRPGGELSRLTWGDIDWAEGTVFISNKKAKTDRSRFFQMPDTLKAWLSTVPHAEREGSVTPSNWPKVWRAIRHVSGIAHSGQDQLRKTFATAHLQHFGDVNITRAIMGHEAGDMLFTNYRGLMRPADAKRFWDIQPGSAEVLRVVGE